LNLSTPIQHLQSFEYRDRKSYCRIKQQSRSNQGWNIERYSTNPRQRIKCTYHYM